MPSLTVVIMMSTAMGSTFYPLGCDPQNQLGTENVSVSAQAGLVDGDTAIMFIMQSRNASFSWQGVGIPSDKGDDVEYYITHNLGDSTVAVLDFWAAGDESEPFLKNNSSVTVVFDFVNNTRFFRQAVMSGVNITNMTVGQPFNLVTVEGSGVPGELNWWSTRSSVQSQVDLTECERDVSPLDQDSSPLDRDVSPLDTTGSLPQLMYEEEGNFTLEMLPGTFHDSVELGIELRLTVNESFLPNVYEAGGWAGVAFPGSMIDADMYVTNGADYLGNLYSVNNSGPSVKEDSSLRFTALDYTSGVFVARFIFPMQNNGSETASFTFDTQIPFGVAFGPGNPDPSVNTLAQDVYAVGNLSFVLRSVIPSPSDEGSDTSIAVAAFISITFFIALGTGLFVYSKRSSLPGAVSLLEGAD